MNMHKEKTVENESTTKFLNPEYVNEIVKIILSSKLSKQEIAKKKVELCIKYKLKKIPSDIEILLNLDKEKSNGVRKYLETKPVRTGSGVAVIAIMSAPFRCPHGKCTYCPGGPGSPFGDVPQSYTGNEPATMRGIRNNYDAYLQVMNRLEQYIALGQNPDKVELIIMGGTFPSFSKEYQEEFVRDALQAMNDFSRLFYSFEGKGFESFKLDEFKEFFELPGSIRAPGRAQKIIKKLLMLKESEESKKNNLENSQLENELAAIRCIGMTIETKPDWGFLEHGNEMLRLGCTRVELGVQTLYDAVLKETHRGHNLSDTKNSIRILKDLGFKLNFHMMPGLPGVSKEMDVACFKELFENSDYKPDMIKVYPTMVMPGTKLYIDFKKGKFKPLNTEEAADIISELFRYVPRYCRIMRVQRDIPIKYSIEGIRKNNLRQLVDEKMLQKGIKANDIRAREIGSGKIEEPIDFEIINYDSSGGNEYFISLMDSKDKLLGFARLRFVSNQLREEFTNETAIIRELHVYGKAVAIGAEGEETQHKGFGAMLMTKAEEICKKSGKNKLLVISGIGVRQYYAKLGYKKQGPYMAKTLK